ncbi:hypothetical protein [Nitrosomonas sp.]|uniref:hypothetical protein n=1 Tax=Nitrosomonas sp. TaxID=42353 RepID=UPI0035B29D9E
MSELDQVRENDIPYRMYAVHSLPAALRLLGRYNTDQIMDIVVGNQSVVIGNLNNYINPTIESGVMHGRALLEFLGLSESSGKLVSTKNKRSGDVSIEDFKLPKVTPEEAICLCKSAYPNVNESIYATLIHLANKGIAHTTTSLVIQDDQSAQLTTASECIIFLVQNCFYSKLGLSKIEFRFAKL